MKFTKVELLAKCVTYILPISVTSFLPKSVTFFFLLTIIWKGVKTTRRFQHNLTNLPGVMYIAALSSTAQRSHYSNYGPGVHLCAPTSNLHTYRRMHIEGLGVTTTTGEGVGITDRFGGTSSSTPLVAGIAALVISANPELDAAAVITLLKETASKDLNFTLYPKTPPTDFDPDTSWDVSPIAPYDVGDFTDIGLQEGTWSPWFGHGKVDALAAITAALAAVQPPPPASETIFDSNSSPNLAIPDHNPIGIIDSITVETSGTLTAISINVDLTHTYIGDLIIGLISPTGTEVILHNRSGASTIDLKTMFDQTINAGLNSLLGTPIQGDWQLVVKDMAAQDIGTLNSWDLKLQFKAPTERLIELSDAPGITIPDNTTTGIERIIKISDSGKIKAFEIDLDITHTYIGDLTVEFVSPRTGSFILHNQTGGKADNIIRTYSALNMQALSNLERKSVKGNWKLRVVDSEARDIGKLNAWRLRFLLE